MRSIKDIVYNIIANALNKRVNIATSPTSTSSVRIAVVKHFDCELPEIFSNKQIYLPLHCGTNTTNQECLCDNTGENISQYNPFLNEMTGLYWIAKHYEEIGNPDFIGLNHYRRFLQWDDSYLHKETIIATSVLLHRKMRNFICFDLIPENRNRLMTFLKERYIDLNLFDFDRYLNGHVMYAANMFIMPRATFQRYFAFIEPIIRLFISLIDKDEIPLRDAPAQEKRLYGYFLEHLTSYWIWREKQTARSKVITTWVQNYQVPRINVSAS